MQRHKLRMVVVVVVVDAFVCFPMEGGLLSIQGNC
jgi:hypothetical protein